jgi:hypothetical protein
MPFYTGHLAAASNRADLIFGVELVDPATNDFVDLTGSQIAVMVRASGQYGASPLLTGTNQDGHIAVTGPGRFTVHFTRNEMTTFAPGNFDIGIVATLNTGVTHQLLAGQLPVVDGIVAA